MVRKASGFVNVLSTRDEGQNVHVRRFHRLRTHILWVETRLLRRNDVPMECRQVERSRQRNSQNGEKTLNGLRKGSCRNNAKSVV